MWTSGCTKMDHPANPECQNVGAPIGVRIVVKKTRRIPIQRWVLSVTGHKNSWLVFLNQKILYSLYFKKHFCNVFHELCFSTVLHSKKTTEQRKGRISNCQNRLPFLAHQNEATQADHYECVLPAAWGLSDWKQPASWNAGSTQGMFGKEDDPEVLGEFCLKMCEFCSLDLQIVSWSLLTCKGPNTFGWSLCLLRQFSPLVASNIERPAVLRGFLNDFVTGNCTGIPSRERHIPTQGMFEVWRWFSFSQGGIC